MYESPISITEKIKHQIAKEKENQVFKAIAQIAVDVDKDELIKALEQYENGYRDGLEAAVIHAHWIDASVDTRYRRWKCSNCDFRIVLYQPIYNFCPNCGAKMDQEVSG